MQRLGRIVTARYALWGALAAALAGAVMATASPAMARPPTLARPLTLARSSVTSITYTFATLGDNKDMTFNQLLGINNQQVIAGYFGSGSSTSPNKGYTVVPPYAQTNFRNENFTHSVQTQVIGINDTSTTVGFWADAASDNFGFVHTAKAGFTSVSNPDTPTTTPSVNQLLGVNNNGIAVGFYVNAAGKQVPYEYNVATKVFTNLTVPKAVSAMAAGINDQNEVVGTETLASGATEGWTLINGTYNALHISTKLNTHTVAAFGINDVGQVVGDYVDAAGNTHGFVDNNGTPQTIDAPGANGFTIVNGINNGGSIVGFYDPTAGDTCVTTCNGFDGVPVPYA
jgi:hypothetical protein